MNKSLFSILTSELESHEDLLVNDCRRLVRVPSPNPSGDTRAIASLIKELVGDIPGLSVETHTCEVGIENLVLHLDSGHPGKRLIFNGHLDTFPAGDLSIWEQDPFGGACINGRLYGRGVSDMKGGIACSLQAIRLLAKYRGHWKGEVVMTLAGDEETMGHRGTQFLLETVQHATGDVMICGDVGSPQVLRFGEKGMIWLELNAQGKASHGAHVHKGVNAIDRLMEGMSLMKQLENIPVNMPDDIRKAISKAAPVSEILGGIGESEVLSQVTVNFGIIEGGTSPNLVAESAKVGIDIRLPIGVSVEVVESRIHQMILPLEGLGCDILRRYEPNWTNPDHPIFQIMKKNAEQRLGQDVVTNIRVGASDARLYRLANIPTVVCGLTAFNLGGADEYIIVKELHDLAAIHTLTAFEYLSS